jgi:hypothetical protein
MDDIHKCIVNHARTSLTTLKDVDEPEARQTAIDRMSLLEERAVEKLKRDLREPSKNKAKMLPIASLPLRQTNWYKLYTDILANIEDMPGLRNRRRIWSRMCRIVQKMQQGRGAEPNVSSDFISMDKVEWTVGAADRVTLSQEDRDRLYNCAVR